MKTLRKLAAPMIMALALVLPTVALVAPVGAVEVNQDLNRGICFTDPDSPDCTNPSVDTDAEGDIQNIVTTIINIFSIIVGAVSVIMIIIGGLRYITSAGDSSNVSGAKNTILYAIVGLVIVIFAQTIVKFVVSRLSDS